MLIRWESHKVFPNSTKSTGTKTKVGRRWTRSKWRVTDSELTRFLTAAFNKTGGGGGLWRDLERLLTSEYEKSRPFVRSELIIASARLILGSRFDALTHVGYNVRIIAGRDYNVRYAGPIASGRRYQVRILDVPAPDSGISRRRCEYCTDPASRLRFNVAMNNRNRSQSQSEQNDDTP